MMDSSVFFSRNVTYVTDVLNHIFHAKDPSSCRNARNLGMAMAWDDTEPSECHEK